MTNQYKLPWELVREFNTSAGQPVRRELALDVPETQLRFDLVDEEVNELREAFDNNDEVEVIDACADIVYVVAGAALTHGIELDPEMARITGEEADYDMLKSLVETVEEFRNQYRDLLPQLPSSTKEEQEIIATKLAWLWNSTILCSYNIAHYVGIDLDVVLDEVHASNMSKFDENGLPIKREDGKVIKGPNYFRPDIPKVLSKNKYEASVDLYLRGLGYETPAF